MVLISAEFFHALAGLLLLGIAVRIMIVRGKGAARVQSGERWSTVAGSAAFYALLGATFLIGKHVRPEAVGVMVVVMVVLAAMGKVTGARRLDDDAPARAANAARLGNRLLLPTVLIPVVVVGGGFVLGRVKGDGWTLVDAKQVNQVALGLGCVIGLIAALRITRARPTTAVEEGGRLLCAVGWALVLPQLLAGLGGIFARAGVGELIAQGVGAVLPTHIPVVAVVAYCAGMALFTVIMGNAFAAFPVVTLGIGLPFIVRQHGGDPAIMGALGMLSGYCGTLLTPMAANFNLVPAMLLEIDDPRGVIKAQAPFAIALWVFNTVAMAVLVYRF